jgi:replicative DNA helicase
MNQLPQSQAAEAAAISLLTEVPKLWDRFPWQEDLFTLPAARTTFRLMQQVRAKGGEAEKLAVLSEAQINNMTPEDMISVVSIMNESAGQDADYYFRTLVEIRARRKTIATALAGAEKLAQNELTPTEFLGQLSDAAATPFFERKTIAEHIRALINDMESLVEPEAFPTGLKALDARWPLRRGCLGVVAGPTSGGKSVLLCMAALQAILQSKRVYFISLEMTEPEVLQRIIANSINHEVRRGVRFPKKSLYDDFRNIAMQLSKSKFFISRTSDIDLIGQEVRTFAPDLVVVDYVQLVSTTGKQESREQVVSSFARALKNLALDLNCCVLTASQLNDDGRLRESRAIGQHADNVLTIVADEDKPGFSIDKVRNGQARVFVPAQLHGKVSRFE